MKTADWTNSLAIRAAWMSFIGRSTQGEIAKRLGVSPAKVHRLIAHAQKEGLIKFQVEARPAECMALEQKFADKKALTNCFIAPDMGPVEDPFYGIASIAGQFLHRLLQSDEVTRIGIGMGRTLKATVSSMPLMQKPELNVVSISGSLTRRLSANPYDVVQQLQSLIGAEGFYLPVPYMAESKEQRDMFLAQRSVQELLARARGSDAFVVGIGALHWDSHLIQRRLITEVEHNELKESAACCDFMGRFIDKTGALCPVSLNDKAVGLHFEDVRGARVVAVASGADKAEATLAALNTGVITDLLIDEQLAQELSSLMENEESETAR
ncbi:sugar-binding transcriptional regulator [Polycladidibacter stylochi]|uniref:sugar-binding transcriptional regulator n=1 Tax=Polycladidibacter stylochi TaxID=1807766 RepID=UPI000A65AE87|nr:sugar-binding domain-containing protein [Pseudovibrio stylochi]